MGVLHEGGKPVLHPEHLVDRVGVEAKALRFHHHVEQRQQDLLRARVGGVELVVIVGERRLASVTNEREHAVASGDAGVVEIVAVVVDAHGLEHPERAQQFRALERDLERRAGEEEIDVVRLEVPDVDEEGSRGQNQEPEQGNQGPQGLFQSSHLGSPKGKRNSEKEALSRDSLRLRSRRSVFSRLAVSQPDEAAGYPPGSRPMRRPARRCAP